MSVLQIIDTLVAKGEFVRDNMDWAALFEDVKNSELLYLSILYLLLKKIVCEVDKNTYDNVVKPFLKVYNLAMVIYSLGTFVVMVKVLQEIPLYTNDCALAFKNEHFELAAKLFYYSKFVEYIDSISLLLRKGGAKNVTFLQAFHHLGAPIDMWLFYTTQNEAIWIMCLLNSLVHTIMYFYYFCTLLKIRTPLKPLITLGQITQFHVGFYLVWFYHEIPCFAQSPRHVLGWLFNYWYVGTVLVLFVNFAVWTYIFPKNKKKQE
eukprot:Rhum_TRINITY_DN25065_c0_g1::Rhum_TRINITY_DN25065_c0_g1_i1::g.181142::m.181142